jgi:hypothetical protein
MADFGEGAALTPLEMILEPILDALELLGLGGEVSELGEHDHGDDPFGGDDHGDGDEGGDDPFEPEEPADKEAARQVLRITAEDLG